MPNRSCGFMDLKMASVRCTLTCMWNKVCTKKKCSNCHHAMLHQLTYITTMVQDLIELSSMLCGLSPPAALAPN